jgi:hypothetical protein
MEGTAGKDETYGSTNLHKNYTYSSFLEDLHHWLDDHATKLLLDFLNKAVHQMLMVTC